MLSPNHFEIYLAGSADSPRYTEVHGEKSKIAPAAYTAILPDSSSERIFWGVGYISNPEALFAHGIMHVLDTLFVDEEISDENFSLRVVVKNNGTVAYLEKHLPKWVQEGGMDGISTRHNNHKTWSRLYTLYALGKIEIAKPKRSDTNSCELVKRVGIEAGNRKDKAPDCTPNSREGIVTSDHYCVPKPNDHCKGSS